MKFYLRVPYSERLQAKALGARWEPSTKRWYVLSETAYHACKRWAQPLTAEQREYLAAPGRSAAYSRAMEQWHADKKAGKLDFLPSRGRR